MTQIDPAFARMPRGSYAQMVCFPRFALLLILTARTAWANPPSRPENDSRAVVAAETPSKKELWLKEKAAKTKAGTRVSPAKPSRSVSITTLIHTWTKERLPIVNGKAPEQPLLDRFFRCRFTNQEIRIERGAFAIVLSAAKKFAATEIEVISGFRSPKHNLWLRKKLHEVGRESEHVQGNAIDFRLPAVPAKALFRYVKSLKAGGVGYYPKSRFVHADTGRTRFWRGN